MEVEWILNKGILAKGEFELERCGCTQQLCPSVTIGHIFLHVVGNECEMSEVCHRRKQTFDFIQGDAVKSNRQSLQVG
jgi:hypothetical protein